MYTAGEGNEQVITKHTTNVTPLLAQRRRRWANNGATLVYELLLAVTGQVISPYRTLPEEILSWPESQGIPSYRPDNASMTWNTN